MKQITSINNFIVTDAYKIKLNKVSNYFIVDGYHLVMTALQANLLDSIFTANIDDLSKKEFANIKTYYVNEAIINKLANTKTPNKIIGIVKKNTLSLVKTNKLVVLENIQDPGNVGAIIRTAKALNYDGILLVGDCAHYYNFKTVSASQGAVFFIPILIYKNINEVIKEFNNPIIATVINHKSMQNVKNFKHLDKFIIALGNEAKGLSNELINLSKYKITIPMNNFDSLNVASAAAIFLFFLN